MRKGFTLIELLAVIVIIAVIALITIPLIGRVIENSKKGALTASASGIIEAAEIYYSTKMMENPETKTFTCSLEGCKSEEEKLDYKGQVSEGRVILYSDGKVSICIEDGFHAALKLATQSEITTEEGSCNYESEDYSIDATISKSKYNELQEELNNTKVEVTNGKKLIANSITNKGIATAEDATFEEMSANIDNIVTEASGVSQTQLYESLQYSGLVTSDMSSEEILSALATEFPASIDFIQAFSVDNWEAFPGIDVLQLSDSSEFIANVSNQSTSVAGSSDVTLTYKMPFIISEKHTMTIIGINITGPSCNTYFEFSKDGVEWVSAISINKTTASSENLTLQYQLNLADFVGYKYFRLKFTRVSPHGNGVRLTTFKIE